MDDYDASDSTLCPDCDERVDDGFSFHTSCCGHEDVESSDEADGVIGNGAAHVWISYCHACGATVVPTEDGEGWEVAA